MAQHSVQKLMALEYEDIRKNERESMDINHRARHQHHYHHSPTFPALHNTTHQLYITTSPPLTNVSSSTHHHSPALHHNITITHQRFQFYTPPLTSSTSQHHHHSLTFPALHSTTHQLYITTSPPLTNVSSSCRSCPSSTLNLSTVPCSRSFSDMS